MAHQQCTLPAVTVLIITFICPILITGAALDNSNAQAIAVTGVSSSSDNSDNQPINLVRRYVPRFVGKRENNDNIVEADDKENYNTVKEGEIDDAVNQFVEYINTMDYKDGEGVIEGENEETIEDLEDLGYSANDDEDSYIDSQEEKRFQPTFIGRRAYKPTFLGKRYQPMFVGKRYTPKFIGKRYKPMFVGKRYKPMFVGKRYQPMFVGKRYQPMFVGKRYTPKFIGKRFQPSFIGKRFQPSFIGKRFTPSFIGKRDVSESTAADTTEHVKNVRRKRSLSEDPTELLKRAWGRYSPLARYGAFKRYPEQTAYKRFVAPEFIGRRDSLSSILSALDALQYIEHPGRSTSKRFEAPMFIGKRPFTPSFVGKRAMRPMFIGKRSPVFADSLQDFGLINQSFGLNPYEYAPSQELSADSL